MLKAILIVAILLSACDSELMVNPNSKRAAKPSIETLNKVSVKPGDQVSFFGENLSADMEIAVGGVPAIFILENASKGSFIVPDGVASEAGVMEVSFSVKNKNFVSFPVIDNDAIDSQPIVPVPEDSVCNTIIYKNESGDMVRGKVNCAIVPACAEDGETDCWATATVPAVAKIDLETKLATGVSIGSVTGTACSVDDSPLAVMSGLPVGSSNALDLNVTIAGDGITHYRYKIRENTDAPCSEGLGYSSERTVLQPIDDDLRAFSDGQLQLCVLVKDAEGNWQAENNASSSSWTKDTITPTALLSNVPSGTNSSIALHATVAGTDVIQYRYKIRDSLATACSDISGYGPAIAIALAVNDSIASLADGPLEICVLGRDGAGNWQAETTPTTAAWTKDTLAPNAIISGSPSGTNNTSSLNVLVSGTDVSHYKYKIRTTAQAACSAASGYSAEAPVASPISSDISAVSDGVLELCVIGRDVYGNWQSEATAATSSWTKDTLPPAATLSGAPTGSSLSTALNITVAGTDVIAYKYKLREPTDLPCSNSTGYSAEIAVLTHISNNIVGLADGALEVCVIGKDSIGNWQLEGTATTASWTKDSSPPTATISNAPTATNNTSVLDITIAGTDVTQYKYKLREPADAACSASSGYSAAIPIATKITSSLLSLGDGTVEVCVIGKDIAGNWQSEAIATTASWTKDTAAPTASITGAPAGTNNSTVLNVTIGGASVSHYKFKVREPASASCADSSGYGSERPVASLITDDISALADGVLQLCVIGRDASGNWQTEASAATASWTKDALPPAATLSGQPTGSSLSTVLNITVAGTGVVEYKYKIRETADPACSNSTGYSSAIAVATPISNDISALADGTIQVCAIGKDATGNWQLEGTATAASWTKDTTAPAASISNAPTATNNTTVLDITIAGTDVTQYKYKLREPADAACSASSGYSAAIPVATKITSSLLSLGDGTVEVCVIGKDTAGNWQTEASAATASWTKDTTAPTATISGAPTGTNATTTLNVTIAGVAVTHYKFKARDSSDTACSNATGYSSEVPVASPITSDISGLDDGTIELCVIGRDAAGNWQAEASAATASWTKDALPPAAILSGQPSGSSNSSVLDITVSGADIVEYKYKIRESTDLSCANSTGYSAAIAVGTHITDNIAGLADGVLQVCVIAKDNSGNWQLEGTATAADWTKDTVAAVAAITDEPTGINATITLNVSIGGVGVSHYKYKIREAATTACSNSAGYSASRAIATKITDGIALFSEGTIELCVIAQDAAGNWQTEASATAVSWVKDTTAPTATISGQPSGSSSSTSLNVTISGADLTHYKYKIREAADPICSNSAGYSSEFAVATAITNSLSALSDGVLQLCVIGRDSLGNWQAEASATTASWTKDTAGPTGILSGAPSGSSPSTVLNITVSGADVVEYKYRIRVSTDAACSNSTGYSSATPVATLITDDISAKADGIIEVCLIGKDSSGNWQLEASASTASWTKDTAAPTATISGAPIASNNTTALNITIAGTGVTEYKYKIRETATTACSNSAGYSLAAPVATAITDSLSGFADGAMEICVIGRDAAGNWQTEASATTASWTKDTAAPTASFSGQPTGTNLTTVLNVSVAGTAVSHYKYKVRASADAACSNAAGYSAETAVSTAITADFSALADGSIELCVIGRDAQGNWQAEAAATTASWTKDTTGPSAVITGAPTGTSLSTSLNITISGADIIEYKYKIRVSADTACSNSTGYSSAIAVATLITDDISAKADGIIEVCLIGKDSSGNWQLEASASAASWTKDTTAPSATISGAPTATNNTTTLNITIAGTGVTEYKYKIRESATTACSNSAGYSLAAPVATAITDSLSGFADGAMEICVIGRDAAGNWQTEASATTASWTKDTAAPTASFSGQPTGTNLTTVLNVSVAGTAVSHYKFKVRASADAACSNAAGYSAETAVSTAITADFSALADGMIELCVIGRDAQGNWQAEAAATTASWTKDTTGPSAVITGAPTGTSLSTNLDITVSGADVVEYKYKIRVPADTACSNSTGYSSAIAVATHITNDISAKVDGTIEVCVIGKDSLGNWQLEASASAASWTKDTTAPSATISGAPTSTNSTTTLNITVAGTGVTEYKYKIRESATTACSSSAGYGSAIAVSNAISDSISGLGDGTIEICVIGRDAAGNWQTEASATTASWIKDTTAPTSSISGAPTGSSATTVLNITIAGTDVSHYKYKIRESLDAPCSNVSGYSGSEIAVATHITDDISAKADGSIELCVIGRDGYGNWQAAAAATAASWTKDTTAPTADLSGAPSGTSSSTSLNITVAGSGVVEYKYKIRVPADAACSSSSGYSSAIAVGTPITDSITGKADGTIQVCAIGKDSAGNWQLEASATNASWTKDTAAPTATVSGAPTSTNATVTLNITIAGTDVTHYKYKVRASGDSACSSSSDYSSEVAVATPITDDITAKADGTIELCVIGRDASNNWQLLSAASSVTWTKDTTAPVASFSGEPTGTNNTTTLSVTVTGTAVSHYKYKVRVPADVACSDASNYSAEIAVATLINSSVSALADGVLQLCVIGRDASGNWQTEATAATASWTKDTTLPAATLSGEPTGTNSVETLNVTVAGTDVTHYKYKVRVPATTACSDSSDYSAAIAVGTHITTDLSGLADGVIQLCVIGKDTAGNWQLEGTATVVSWTKDTTAPTATFSGEPSSLSATTTLDVTVAGTDVTQYRYKIRVPADSACSVVTGYSSSVAVATHITTDISALADGTVELCVIGADASGNWQLLASATSASWTKSTVGPTATISGAPTGASATVILDVTIAGTNVTHYKYKIRSSADTACSDGTGYSGEIAIATHITNNITSMIEGTTEICVVARGVTNIYQSFASASSVSWLKDASSPSPPLTFRGKPRENAILMLWTNSSNGTDDHAGFIILKSTTGIVSDAPVKGTSYVVGNTIGSTTVVYVGTNPSFTDTNVTLGTTYYYKIFAFDHGPTYTSGGGGLSPVQSIAKEPPSVDDLLFWTDASYVPSVQDNSFAPITTDGTAVRGINNIANPYMALMSQGTVGMRPVYKTSAIYGHVALRHSNTHLVSGIAASMPTGNLQHSLVYIGSFSDTVASGAIQIGSAANDSAIKLLADSGQIIYSFGNNDLKYTAPTTTTAKVYLGTYNGVDGTNANRKFYIDGAPQTVAASSGTLTNTLNLPSPPIVYLGSDSASTQYLSGDTGEFLLYDHVLSPSEIIDLSKYAWDKWSIPQITLSASSTPSSIALNWTDGTASASYLLVRRAGSAPTFTPTNGVSYSTGAQGADTIIYANTALTYTDSSVVGGTTYHYAVFGNDGSDNYTPAVSISAKILVTPDLSATAGDSENSLTWSSVTEASGYLLVRKAGSAPTFVPTPGQTYSTGTQGSDMVIYVGTGTSYTDTSLTNNTTYHYKLYAYDASLNYASAKSQTGTPVGSCAGSTNTYSSDTSITVPAGCTTVELELWGAGGAGGASGGSGGIGGSGGKAIWNNVTAGVSISSGNSIVIKIGQPGAAPASSAGGAGSSDASTLTSGQGGNGGAVGAVGSAGAGTGTGGAGTAGTFMGKTGGAGKYGGGGGGGGYASGGGQAAGGGGGATAVSVAGTVRAIAGGGGGGGGGSVGGTGGAGGVGCGGAAGAASGNYTGGGGGGGACLGTSETAGGGAAGGAANAGGTAGKVIVTFSP